MDRVRLLPKHMVKFAWLKENDGKFDELGNWVDGTIEKIEFKACPFPIDQRTLSLLPQGVLNNNSIKIYTKFNLEEILDINLERLDTNEVYRVYNGKAFTTIADINIYLLNRWDGES